MAAAALRGGLVADTAEPGRPGGAAAGPVHQPGRGPDPGQDPAARAGQAARLAAATARRHLAGAMAGQRGRRRRLRLERIAVEGTRPDPASSARRAVRGTCPARGRAGHPARLPLAAEPADDGDARRGPGRPRPRCLRWPGDPGPARDGLGPLGRAEQDHLDGDPQGRPGQRHHRRRLPRADGGPGRAPFPGQRGPTIVLRPAQGHRRAPRRGAVAAAGAADRGPPQHRPDRGRVRHRVPARPGPAGGVLHRTGARAGPHLAALHRPQPVPAVLARPGDPSSRHRLAPAAAAGRAGVEGAPELHPRCRRAAGAAPDQLPQRAGVRPGLLRGHRPVGRRRPGPVGAVGGAEPGQGRRVHAKEVKIAGEVADGPADQDAAAAAARPPARRRTAARGRRGAHHRRP